MNFFDVINERHSIRAYQKRAIEAEKIQKILEAVNRAPSAGNLQGFEVYVVRDAGQRKALVSAAGGQGFLEQAPVVFIFCAHPVRSAERYGKRGINLYCIQDATIACTFAMLAATAEGLSSVWVGAFEEQTVREIAGIPEGLRPVAMLPVGYADGEPRLRPRRDLSDLVHFV